MRRVIIIQARMGSTRLPGKVLMEVAGKPMLAQQLRRLKACRNADDIVIATTTTVVDEPIVDLAHREGVSVFRGHEQDVLGRFVHASKYSKADVVVRITADCPLIDPQLTDRVIGELIEHSQGCDYVSNVIERTFPRGLDVEALFLDTLLRMDRLAHSRSAREHVTILLRFERPDLFLLRSVVDQENNADLRWTVDTAGDLKMIRILYERMGLDSQLKTYPEILAHVRSHPELSQLNANVETWEPPRQIS
jgi:spore coat polysaccharide biosynthesis protein SpsF